MQKITFATNTAANTIEYTKLLLKSLKQNLSSDEHEILVFIDNDNDGTYEYLKSVKSEFKDLKIVRHKVKPVVGYQRNSNIIVELAKYNIVSYIQSDMVVSKNYDLNVLEDLEENCILSSTRIEPPLHGESNVTFTNNLGLHPEDFKWEEFLSFSERVKSDRVENYFFAPYTFHKETWKSVGGYDTLFRRAREDSDFVQRCVHTGIKLKQTFKANVYHFTCVSSRGQNWFDSNNEKAKRRVELQKMADSIELSRFIKKWGGFNHGESKLFKIDTDLVINREDIDPQFLLKLEPFFSRVWLKSEKNKADVLQLLSKQHDPANELFGFSQDDWEKAKHLFNCIDFESIYFVGEPEDWNVRIDLDLFKVSKPDPFLDNILNISEIIGPSDPGVYELGCAKIDIRKVVNVSDDYLVTKNPPFDDNLLIIE